MTKNICIYNDKDVQMKDNKNKKNKYHIVGIVPNKTI